MSTPPSFHCLSMGSLAPLPFFQVHLTPVAPFCIGLKNTIFYWDEFFIGIQQGREMVGTVWLIFLFVLLLHLRFTGFLKARSGLLSLWEFVFSCTFCSHPFSPAPVWFPKLSALGFCPVRCAFFVCFLS